MEAKLLVSKIGDACRICNATSFPKFVGFLSPEEAALAETAVKKLHCKFCFYGGFEEAERRYLGIFPDWCDDFEEYFPIIPLTFLYRKGDVLSHRNFLGSFMSLGIARETVGDILIEEGRAVAFFSEDIASYVKGQISKISNVGVTIEEGFSAPLPGVGGFKDITDTVASARLDCVVAALAKCSRATACELIEGKVVAVNSVCCEKTVKTVNDGDRITIRGKGKFIVEAVNMRSKKDRLVLKAKKYI